MISRIPLTVWLLVFLLCLGVVAWLLFHPAHDPWDGIFPGATYDGKTLIQKDGNP